MSVCSSRAQRHSWYDACLTRKDNDLTFHSTSFLTSKDVVVLVIVAIVVVVVVVHNDVSTLISWKIQLTCTVRSISSSLSLSLFLSRKRKRKRRSFHLSFTWILSRSPGTSWILRTNALYINVLVSWLPDARASWSSSFSSVSYCGTVLSKSQWWRTNEVDKEKKRKKDRGNRLWRPDDSTKSRLGPVAQERAESALN